MQVHAGNIESMTREWTETETRLDQIYEAAMVRGLTEQNLRLGITRPASGIGYRAVVAMPVMLAICTRPPQIPPWAQLAIWTGSTNAYQAVRDCWNAGLRGDGLLPPEGWVPVTVH